MSVLRHPGRAHGRLRTTAWRDDPLTAQLAIGHGRPSGEELALTLDRLRQEGYRAVLTTALAPADQAVFRSLGFEDHEHLRLLARPVEPLLAASAPPPAVRLRRCRAADQGAVLTVDGRAFEPFWRFSQAGLDDAMGATPSARLRVAERRDGGVVGYAITGRAGGRGYLQRLAVDPDAQRVGVGTSLVADGLRWLRRWGARQVFVNTQEHNAAALALYESLGFHRQPEDLVVLRRALAVDHR